MSHFIRWQERLSVQTITTLLGLVILTALAIGIPVLWILRSQLESQARALVEQGSQTSMALLANRQSDLNNLALLTAQRPTLQLLVEDENWVDLAPYLETLRQGGGLDLLVICSSDGKLVMQVGGPLSEQTCLIPPGPFLDGSIVGNPAWLLASAEAFLDTKSIRVAAGARLDDRFAAQLARGTGFEQMLLYNGVYVASSFPGGTGLGFEHDQGQFNLTFNTQPYYAHRVPYDADGFEWVVAAPTSDLLQAQTQLTWMVAGGILGVIAVSSTLGLARSRRMTRPLEQLKQAADAFRLGQFSRPVRVETNIFELAILSYAMEDARLAINHSLAELSREKAWTEHILESVVEGIVTLDKRRQITFFSHGAEEITGLKAEEVIGRDVDDVFSVYESGEAFSRRIPQAGGNQKVVVWLHGGPKGRGRPATLAVTGARLAPPEAGRADTALVLRDVSNEEAIRRLLGEFMANISHEFRTPLSALAASIELLLDQLPDLSQQELKDLLDNIHLGTLSLQQLIDNLLEGASIETGRFRVVLRAVEVEEILVEAARLVQPLVNKYHLSLIIDCPEGLPKVDADFRRCVQVVLNLLSNAIKWSPAGSEILLSVSPTTDWVEIRVDDQGPGIPEECLPELFYRFGQTPGSERGNQGAGLGLSVVKAIVEAHGGEVGVRNKPESGAVFWFTLVYSAIEAGP
jgi:PAS domain S-box-containing protein